MSLFRYISKAFSFFARPYYRYIGRRKYLEQVTLTAEGFAYLTVASFITFGSILRNVNLLILMTGIMFGPLFINWRLAVHRVRSLRGRRQLPTRIQANEMISVQWNCENAEGAVPAMNVVVRDQIRRAPDELQTLQRHSRRTSFSESKADRRLFAELRDRLFGRAVDSTTAESLVRFQRLIGGRGAILNYRAFFQKRGKYSFGPAEINCSFPFGLILSRQRIGQESQVFVGPELGVLSPTWEKRLNSTATGNDSVRRNKAIEEDEFFALRRWRSGDSRKNIHWRSTAKHGFPIVKQFVERNNRDFALVLDLFVDDDQPDTLQNCEVALSCAATILLSVKVNVEGQAAMAVCGKTREMYRSKTVGSLAMEAMPALAVAAGDSTPATEEGVVTCLETVSNGTPIYVISSREMPASLRQGLQPESNSNNARPVQGTEAERQLAHRSRYVARRMRMGLPMVRWLNVQSNEFEEVFRVGQNSKRQTSKPTTDQTHQEIDSNDINLTPVDHRAMPSDLAKVSQNWIDHANR